ncbi:MAG: hypothetical protein AB2A00_22020 [Myxococcota bacterium]
MRVTLVLGVVAASARTACTRPDPLDPPPPDASTSCPPPATTRPCAEFTVDCPLSDAGSAACSRYLPGTPIIAAPATTGRVRLLADDEVPVLHLGNVKVAEHCGDGFAVLADERVLHVRPTSEGRWTVSDGGSLETPDGAWRVWTGEGLTWDGESFFRAYTTRDTDGGAHAYVVRHGECLAPLGPPVRVTRDRVPDNNVGDVSVQCSSGRCLYQRSGARVRTADGGVEVQAEAVFHSPDGTTLWHHAIRYPPGQWKRYRLVGDHVFWEESTCREPALHRLTAVDERGDVVAGNHHELPAHCGGDSPGDFLLGSQNGRQDRILGQGFACCEEETLSGCPVERFVAVWCWDGQGPLAQLNLEQPPRADQDSPWDLTPALLGPDDERAAFRRLSSPRRWLMRRRAANLQYLDRDWVDLTPLARVWPPLEPYGVTIRYDDGAWMLFANRTDPLSGRRTLVIRRFVIE